LVEAIENNKNGAKVFVIGNKVDSKKEVESYSLETLKSSNITAFYEVSLRELRSVPKRTPTSSRLSPASPRSSTPASPPAAQSPRSKETGSSRLPRRDLSPEPRAETQPTKSAAGDLKCSLLIL
jgi:hypothetical protein